MQKVKEEVRDNIAIQVGEKSPLPFNTWTCCGRHFVVVLELSQFVTRLVMLSHKKLPDQTNQNAANHGHYFVHVPRTWARAFP